MVQHYFDLVAITLLIPTRTIHFYKKALSQATVVYRDFVQPLAEFHKFKSFLLTFSLIDVVCSVMFFYNIRICITVYFFFNGLLLPYTHSIFFPLLFFVFFLVFFQQNNFKIADQNCKSVRHTHDAETCDVPTADAQLSTCSIDGWNVRPLPASGAYQKLPRKKEGFCRVLVIAVDFLKVKSHIELARTIF